MFGQKKQQELERNRLLGKIKKYQSELKKYKTLFPPGHFYSPVPNIKEIKKKESSIFKKEKEILGIYLNEKEQLDFFNQLKKFYKDLPFHHTKQKKLRYFYNNPNYSYTDAILLYLLGN